MPKQNRRKVSERNQDVRDKLINDGYYVLWQVVGESQSVTAWRNGRTLVLLLDYCRDGINWDGWDLFKPISDSLDISVVFAALAKHHDWVHRAV